MLYYAENTEEAQEKGVVVSEKEVAIAKALLNYGGYAQDYFVKKDAEKNAYIDVDRAYTNVEKTLSTPDVRVIDTPELGKNISYYGAAVAFDHTTDIRLYFHVTDNIDNHKFSVTRNGKVANAEPVLLTDNYYYISIDDIYANALGTEFGIEVDGVSFEYGVYNYIASALNATEVQSGALTELQNLVKAMYQYAEAVNS